MNKLPWIVGASAVMLLSAALFARQGVVVMTDRGQRYAGDITDKGTMVEILVPDPAKGPKATKPVVVSRAAIKDIFYSDEIARQVREGVAKLDRRDVKTRITMAQQALDYGATDAARDVLTEAAAIDPSNRDVQAMLNKIRATGVDSATAAPSTQPAATATAATQPSQSGPPKREVTPEEVNRIRQLEWDRKEPVTLRIDPDTRQRYIAASGMTAAEFAKLTPLQQAAEILDKGKPDLADGVHINKDPASVADYHKIQRNILTSCATAGCHGGPSAKGGSFLLFMPDNPQAYYTNFLELQTYSKKIGDVQRLMIDRTTPERSLILEYMLPDKIAQTPHPTLPNYKGAVRTKTDPKYTTVYDWIQRLPPVAPAYDIDLGKEPAKKEPRPAASTAR